MMPDEIDYEDDAQNLTENVENSESGSLLEESTACMVIDRSLIGHSVGHSDNLGGYVVGSKPQKKGSKSFKAGQEDDDKEPESKLARHIADALVDTLAYDEIGSEWYSQSSGLWKATTDKKALKTIMGVLDVGMPNGYAIAKLNNVKSFLMIYLLLDKWANNRHLLPMKNGVLDTKTMLLSDYSHKHRFNWQLPYSFDPDAKLHVIKQWLWDASGKDLESVNIIRAFFKMALVGGEVQKFLELIGAGGTGKSTLIRLLVAFIGEKNHASTDLKNLEINRFEAAALYGKKLALISDSSRYGGEVSVLKALTGGDPVRLEKKNVQQSGSFVFEGVVVIASNEAIQTADYTSGLGRRRMPVNFNSKVTDADKQKWAAVGGIEAAMHSELPGLLNWATSMPDAEVKRVIGGINGQMTQTQRDHLVETNKIAAWLDDNIVIDPNAIIVIGCSMKKKTDTGEINQARRDRLYANYESWCDDNAVHPVALNRFTANVLDVCGLMKIDTIKMNKTSTGVPIKGITIRNYTHSTYATPITKKLLNDALLPMNDLSMTRQAIDNSSDDPHDPIISSVIKNTVSNEVPEFI
ncbi:MAG: phage/plasmid primase, P4 family [Methylobacter sp.]|nr:phage/plasmid primase, P4 family [Methylobacter sp.]